MVSKCFRVVIYEVLIDVPNLGLAGLGLPETEEVGGPHSASFSDKAWRAGWDGLYLCAGPGGGGGLWHRG